MAKVIDKAAGIEIDVSASEAQRGALEGRYQLPKGGIKMSRAGRVVDVDASELGTLVGTGWKLTDDDEAERIKLRRQESDAGSLAIGAAEAAARGATLGLSDLAIDQLGGDPERMAARRDALGGAGMALEIAGAAAPALLSGGASTGASAGSLGARAGRAALRYSPAGMAARAGRAAEAGVGLRTLGGSVASNAVEGYAFGAGAELSEQVLGDRELSAERILGAEGGGMGLLLGGGAGILLPGATKVARGIYDAPGKAVRKVLGRHNAAAGEATGLVADAVAKSDPMLSAYAGFTGAPEAAVSRTVQRVRGGAASRAELVDIMAREPQLREEAARELMDSLNGASETVGNAIRLTQGAQKYKKLGELGIDDLTPEQIGARDFGSHSAEDVIRGQRALDVADEVARTMEAKLAKMAETNASTGFRSFEVNALRKAEALVTRLRTEMAESATPRGAFEAMDRFNRDLGLVVKETGGWKAPNPMAPTDLVAANFELRNLYKQAQEHLTTDALYGKGAALQREGNDALSGLLHAQDKLRRNVGRVFTPDGAVNSAQALKIIRSTGLKGKAAEESLDDVLAAQEKFLKHAEDNYELSPEQLAAHDAARESIANVRTTIAKRRHQAEILDDLDALKIAERGTLVGAQIAGGYVGHEIGGTPGAMLGFAAGGLTRPFTLTKTIASLWHMADKAGIRMNAGVGRAVARIEGKKVPEAAARKAPTGFAAANLDPDKLRERVARIATNPALLAEEANLPLREISEVAPHLANEMLKKTHLAALFLANHIPQAYYSPLSGRKPKYDVIAEQRFKRLAEAVLDPISTIEKFAEGKLTPDHVKALRAVWPALYDDAKQTIFAALANAQALGHKVPLKMRLGAGELFGIAADPIHRPGVSQAVQAALANVESIVQPAKSNGKKPPSTAPVKGVPTSSSYATTSSRMERPKTA